MRVLGLIDALYEMNPNVVVAVALMISMAGLVNQLRTGRRTRRVRTGFDLARVVVQIVAVVAMGILSGRSSTAGIAIIAAGFGMALGLVQGRTVELSVEGDRVLARRSWVAFGVWSAGLIMMQISIAAGRVGWFDVGRAVSWFSIGVAVGVLGSRTPRVDAARAGAIAARTAAVVLLAIGATAALGTVSPDRAIADSCPPAPAGFSVVDSDPCTYSDGVFNAVLTEVESGVCGSELIDYWVGRGGDPSSDVLIREDEESNVFYEDGKTWIQRYFVLADNGVVNIASRSYSGGVAQQFVGTAKAWAAANMTPCSTAAPSAPQTSVVAEDIDPDAVPDVVPIPDQATSTIPGNDETDTSTPGEVTTPDSTGSASTDTTVTEREPTDRDGSIASSGDPDRIDGQEQVDTLVASAIAAALLGLISWAEALERVTQALGGSGHERSAQAVIEEARTRFEAGAVIDPDDPGNDIFRDPDRGVLTVSDGSEGVPPGYVWDPWSSRWLSPDEAADARRDATAAIAGVDGQPLPRSGGGHRFPDGGPVPPGWVYVDDGHPNSGWMSPDDARQRVGWARAEQQRQQEQDDAWDAETERDRAEAEERNERLRQERLAAEQDAALAQSARDAAIRTQITNISRIAADRDWGDILERLDAVYDTDGQVREDHLASLAELTRNRLAADAALDALPDSMMADFAANTLRDMRESTALRLLSGVASGGTSEIAFQGADLGEAILADIDAAIARGEDASRFGPLRRAAEVFAENNLPINTARAVLDGDTSPTAVFTSLLNDALAAGDVVAAGRGSSVLGRLPGQDTLDAVSDAARARAGRGLEHAVDTVAGEGTAAAASRAAQRTADSVGDGLYRADTELGLDRRPGIADRVPDSATGAVDGRPVPGLDGAGDVPAPSTNTDQWVRDAAPGTKIPPEQLRATGYTPAQADAMRQVARDHNVIIGTRTTNPTSTRWIESGEGVPKPVWMKAKTINALDAQLGGPSSAMEGTVGFFEPRLPPNPTPELQARYAQRLKEFEKLRSSIDQLEARGLVEVRDGVVYHLDPSGASSPRPFAGDIDAVVILDANTGAPVGGTRYDAIVGDLRHSDARMQHGAEAQLVNDIEFTTDQRLRGQGLQPGNVDYHRQMNAARRDAHDLLRNLESAHTSGAETVIWTGADGHTVGGPLRELDGWHERGRGRFADTRHTGVRGRANDE